MKAVVLFDSLYGNTEKIANSLTEGLQEVGAEVKCFNINSVALDTFAGYDLLVLGAPTQYFTASKPMKEFLERLKNVDLRGKYAFAFDTKLGSPLSGSAAKFIEKKLKDLQLEIIHPRSSAIVIGQKASGKPGDAILKEGSEEQFENVGKELGVLLLEKARKAVGMVGRGRVPNHC